MFDNSISLAGEVALVTGASSGLGAHFAKVLAGAGANVVVASRRIDNLHSLVQEIESNGGSATALKLDVTQHDSEKEDSISQVIENTENIYGPITVLVNNAGVSDSARFVNTTEESWDFVLDTNLKGAWRVAKAVANRLLALKLKGSIINISSILGMRVAIGESAYAVSKAGLAQLTKAAALELGHKGIRVNALCPGYFKTELNADFFDSEKGRAFISNTPAKRLGRYEELSWPMLLLASDAGSFINGACIPVDGGHLVSSL
ncbi:2-deoxy-D-gluconate 3-dehydrogenase [Gammaproteobacteria bacterium 45_16_T64]|nr:2-deoxy-D-gluconate 3-dehydrogenase [Gammaproteobacteria bacterium 45_16_T64]